MREDSGTEGRRVECTWYKRDGSVVTGWAVRSDTGWNFEVEREEDTNGSSPSILPAQVVPGGGVEA
ncbi:MAG: hypothetical protein KBT28_01565 [Bacteroidales bacterium]|nr:hypothetical protein [Candidatus Colimorpha merdihippi]